MLPAMAEIADEDLLELVRDGDARAFEDVFDRYSGVAWSLAYRICGRRAIADEIVEQAFLCLWRGGATYDRGSAGVRTWILSAVLARAVDQLRRTGAVGVATHSGLPRLPTTFEANDESAQIPGQATPLV